MTTYSEKIKSFWSKVKTIKNIEIIIGIVIICLVVLIYSTVTSKSEPSTPNGVYQNSGEENATELEKRLGEILSQIDGAGEVSVMISYQNNQTTVAEEGQPKTMGVVIVADGADNVKVRINLITATKTLLDVDANAIQIFNRK